MSKTRRHCLALAGFAAVGVLLGPALVLADHSWGNYHWARTANPFTIKLGDNVTTLWDTHLVTASDDWSQSSVLDTVIVTGGTRPKNCRPTSGRVEVCNAKYGFNGWLGIAQIWVTGDHITQGIVKLNDSYFGGAPYNTPAWRSLVMCQEIGHTFGLDHQDEDFNNPPLGTCMDYSSDPEPNQHPNAHDYEQLEIIYAHLDSFDTPSLMPPAMSDLDFSEVRQWGRLVRGSVAAGTSIYELDFGGGNKVFTFVTWAQ